MRFDLFAEPQWEDLAWCSICITGAIIGGVAAAGSVASAAIGAGAAKDAAKAQTQAADKAAAQSEAMYQQTRSDLAPYRSAGEGAITGYNALLGTGPGGMAGRTAALAATPGYQFTQAQGLQAVQNSFAAQGLAQSGPALKGAAQYAEGLAGTTYQSVLGDYYNALGLGESAAANTGQLGTQLTGQANQAVTAAGAATAAGDIGAANATIGGINTAIGGITNALLLPSIFGQTTGIYGKSGGFPQAPGGGYSTANLLATT